MNNADTGQTLILFTLLGLGSLVVGVLAGLVWARTVQRVKSTEALARAQTERAADQIELANVRSELDRTRGELINEREGHELARAELQRERMNTVELERRMQPLQTAVEKLEKRHAEAERSQEKAQMQLREQVTGMGQRFNEASANVHAEARRLNQALSRSEKRGTWGEMQLHRLVESAGMVNQVHYVEQEHTVASGQARRPDMVVNLAGGRSIVVDSKVSLDAFLNLDNDDDQSQALSAHADAVAKHVKDLSSKAYWETYDSPEFVVMFLPAEGLLSAALEVKPALLQNAFDANVVLATPTTLLAVLRTISYAWQQEEIATQAKEIHEEGLELHRRLKTMAGHFQTLGGSLGKAVNSFNKTVSSMESRVIPSARRFETLMSADELATPVELETQPREISPARWQVEIEAVADPKDRIESQDPQQPAMGLAEGTVSHDGIRTA